MAKSAKQISELSALLKRADRIAETATGHWRRTVTEIRKEISYLSGRLNLGGSAADRERVIRAVQLHIVRLKRRLDSLVKSQMDVAAELAHRDVERRTDSIVKRDPKYTRELLQLIEARGGGSMAATFTQAMSRTAVTALRNAVVGAFQENILNGGTARDLTHLIRDRWETAAGDVRNFRFFDRSGREWDTNRYIQMNVRANSMRMYNTQVVRDTIQATGSDLGRISADGRDRLSCDSCKFWSGRVVSLSGKTRGFPSLADAEAAGVFHPNCIHTIEPVDEELDADYIAEQKELWKTDRNSPAARPKDGKGKAR